MPCDSIVLNTVDLPRMNAKLTAAAIKALGWNDSGVYGFFVRGLGSFRVRGGQLEGLNGQSEATIGKVADQLKQSYSAEVVKYTARRNGWQLRQVAAFQFEVIK